MLDKDGEEWESVTFWKMNVLGRQFYVRFILYNCFRSQSSHLSVASSHSRSCDGCASPIIFGDYGLLKWIIILLHPQIVVDNGSGDQIG